jgi:hypothetical protein
LEQQVCAWVGHSYTPWAMVKKVLRMLSTSVRYSLIFSKLNTYHGTVKDELECAMQFIGIKNLSQAHPGLLNTGELDKFVYRQEAHPYARKIVRPSKL